MHLGVEKPKPQALDGVAFVTTAEIKYKGAFDQDFKELTLKQLNNTRKGIWYFFNV